jgi:predicted glycogen debranching enzyme
MDPCAEWIETDGLGGYACGSIGGPRTRRYHALLAVALSPPTRRHVLVNGLDAWVETAGGRFALSSQCYAPGVVHPDGAAHLVDFTDEPWPTWTFRLDEKTTVVQELCVRHGASLAVLSWRLVAKGKRKRGEDARATLTVRPFLTGRDAHALHRENDAFRFEASGGEGRATWQPYESLPAVTALANGTYRHDPLWYRAFLYEEERARGYEATEDCGAPGEFTYELSKLKDATAWLVVGAEFGAARRELTGRASAAALARRVRSAEKRRRGKFEGALDRAADAYLVTRERGKTVVAGYPWFTDWGRDSFVALRGLALSCGRLDDARDVLLAWSRHVSEGMLPNVFPESGSDPEYNSVDAGLWFVVAVKELLAARGARRVVSAADRKRLLAAAAAILDGCFEGTRHGIRVDVDGLLAAGVPGQQLTWMDARADGREVTPRIGKPVEVEALWLNALAFGAAVLPGRRGWLRALATGRSSFATRFWNEARGCLHDVVDVDHVVGTADPSLRPNQIFAVGGLPLQLLSGARARAVVDAVEVQLLTPRGVRTLAPDDPCYRARYEGGPDERGRAYHQGTVWPWLLGPFVEAWCRVRGDTAAVRKKAHAVFLAPLLAELAGRGVVHVPELADGDAPHAWKGAPAQAWSTGELLRATRR